MFAVDTNGLFYYFHLSNLTQPAGGWVDRIVCQTVSVNGTYSPGTFTGLNGTKVQDKETAIVDRKTNTIYVTWTQFDKYGSKNPADSSVILFSYSKNNSGTWSTPVRLNKTAGDCVDSSNTTEGAVPCVGPNGELYVAWMGKEGILFDRSYMAGRHG